MIFVVATLASVCSKAVALQPGNTSITRMSSSMDLARKPQVSLKAGDVCEIKVEGLGVLRNGIVDAA